MQTVLARRYCVIRLNPISKFLRNTHSKRRGVLEATSRRLTRRLGKLTTSSDIFALPQSRSELRILLESLVDGSIIGSPYRLE